MNFLDAPVYTANQWYHDYAVDVRSVFTGIAIIGRTILMLIAPSLSLLSLTRRQYFKVFFYTMSVTAILLVLDYFKVLTTSNG